MNEEWDPHEDWQRMSRARAIAAFPFMCILQLVGGFVDLVIRSLEYIEDATDHINNVLEAWCYRDRERVALLLSECMRFATVGAGVGLFFLAGALVGLGLLAHLNN
jgi:hypothetical protein